MSWSGSRTMLLDIMIHANNWQGGPTGRNHARQCLSRKCLLTTLVGILHEVGPGWQTLALLGCLRLIRYGSKKRLSRPESGHLSGRLNTRGGRENASKPWSQHTPAWCPCIWSVTDCPYMYMDVRYRSGQATPRSKQGHEPCSRNDDWTTDGQYPCRVRPLKHLNNK